MKLQFSYLSVLTITLLFLVGCATTTQPPETNELTSNTKETIQKEQDSRKEEANIRTTDINAVTDLNMLATLLMTYQMDMGSFPNSEGECISPTSPAGEALLAANYLSLNKFPSYDTPETNTLCPSTKEYYYVAPQNSDYFYLAAPMYVQREPNAASDFILTNPTLEEVKTHIEATSIKKDVYVLTSY